MGIISSHYPYFFTIRNFFRWSRQRQRQKASCADGFIETFRNPPRTKRGIKSWTNNRRYCRHHLFLTQSKPHLESRRSINQHSCSTTIMRLKLLKKEPTRRPLMLSEISTSIMGLGVSNPPEWQGRERHQTPQNQIDMLLEMIQKKNN